jgi:hypothetical protein
MRQQTPLCFPICQSWGASSLGTDRLPVALLPPCWSFSVATQFMVTTVREWTSEKHGIGSVLWQSSGLVAEFMVREWTPEKHAIGSHACWLEIRQAWEPIASLKCNHLLGLRKGGVIVHFGNLIAEPLVARDPSVFGRNLRYEEVRDS